MLHAINDRTDPVLLFTDELKTRGFDVVDVRPWAGEPLPATLEGFDGIVAGGRRGRHATRRTSIPGWPTRSS